MPKPPYETVFDLAYGLVLTGSPTERRDAARKAASLVSIALKKADRAGGIAGLEPPLSRLLGKRGAQKLIKTVVAAAATDARRPPRWNPTEPPNIAILTSKVTSDLADELFDGLGALGAHVWFYGKSIKIGRRIRHADELALSAADYIVLLVSRAALRSNFVDFELDVVHWLEMKDRRERLLPVIADDLAFEELPPMLGPISAIAYRDLGVSGIVQAIVDRTNEDREGSWNLGR